MSIYQKIPLTWYENLFNLSKGYTDFLMMGDFNAHHIFWNNTYEDGAGRILARALDGSNLVILNDGEATLVIPPGCRNSIIDLAIASPSVAFKASTHTETDCWGSDHFPIITLIKNNKINNIYKKFSYKLPLSDSILRNFESICYANKKFIEETEWDSMRPAEAYCRFFQEILNNCKTLIPDKDITPKTKLSKSKNIPPK